jgi:hypothetical protein
MKNKLLSAILTALLTASTFALAADLGDYPSFLFEDNNLDAYIVVGSAAAPADVVGAVDLAARLAGESYEVVSTGGDTTVVSGGKSEDIPLGRSMTTSGYLDRVMDDDDLAGLLDSAVNFQSDNYNYQEIVVFGSSRPVPMTSLTSSDDDYASDVYVEVSSGDIAYYWVFDETINVSTATSSQPLTMKFLGKTMKITNVADADTFTAYVGDTYSMNIGDSVTVEGKTVTLENVGSTGSCRISIDGTLYTVSGTETQGGIEITVDDYFYADALAERGATLIMGTQSSETYNSGDKFKKDDNVCNNEPEDTDCWEWHVGGLLTNAATTVGTGGPTAGPYIGVKNAFVINDDSDNPITVGGCYALPNDYAQVCFDSQTVDADDYTTLTLEYDGDADLSQAVSGNTDQDTIHITTTAEEGLQLESDSITGLSADTRTREFWLEVNETDADFVNVYYRNSASQKALAGYVNSTTNNVNFARVYYGDTKGADVELDLSGDASAGASLLNLTFDIQGKTTTDIPDNYDDLNVQLKHASGGAFAGLGATASTEEADELQWAGGTGTITWQNIGTKDEDHRTMYGIVVKNPKSHGASDEVVMEVPSEEVFAKIVVRGPTTTVTAGTSGTVKKVVPVTNAVAKLDTEVSLPVGKHLVLVGGPAVNRLTAQAMGLDYPTYGGSGLLPFAEGQGYIEVVDGVLETGKYAVVVCGWEADNTRDATSVLQQFGSFKTQLDGNMAVKITSVSASGITPVV